MSDELRLLYEPWERSCTSITERSGDDHLKALPRRTLPRAGIAEPTLHRARHGRLA